MSVNQNLEDLADEFKELLSMAREDYNLDDPSSNRYDPYREECALILEFRKPSVLDHFETRADADLLREKGAYIILNWLFQGGSDRQKRLGKEALQEAMYYDRANAGTFGEIYMVQAELEHGERTLGIRAKRALDLPKP